MTLNPFTEALIVLISILFDLYLMVLALRLILHWQGSNYFNPLTQFIIKLTQPVIKPMRKMIPSIKSFETSTFVLMIVLEIIKFLIIQLLRFGLIAPIALIFFVAGDFLKIIINTFFYAILVQAILSWVQGVYSPATQLLSQITSPIIRPFTRWIKPINGIDLSPIPALILLYLLNIILVEPLIRYGYLLAISGH